MKRILFLLLILMNLPASAQIGIGTNLPDSSAELDVSSSSKGLLIPRMTQSQRLAIVKPAEGLMVYQKDGTAGLYLYAGAAWNPIATFTTNTATGQQTLGGNTTGTGNVAVGSSALKTNTTGTNNTAIGYGADVTAANLTNATAIGYNTKVSNSYSIVLGTPGIKVGIGNSFPGYSLDVNGTTRVTGSLYLPVLSGFNIGTYPTLLTMSGSMVNAYIGSPRMVVKYLININGSYPAPQSGTGSIGVAPAGPSMGQIIAFAGNYIPEGYLECNGQLLNISSNTTLYSILGTAYGGNGTTTFALPNLSNTTPVGYDSKYFPTYSVGTRY